MRLRSELIEKGWSGRCGAKLGSKYRGAEGEALHEAMRIVAWNCRSMGNCPDILFLSETKLTEKRLERFKIKLGLMHMVARDCDGKSGGVAMFLRRGINLSLRWKGRMHIDMTVTEDDGFKWRLTGVYDDPKEKAETWRLLRILQKSRETPLAMYW